VSALTCLRLGRDLSARSSSCRGAFAAAASWPSAAAACRCAACNADSKAPSHTYSNSGSTAQHVVSKSGSRTGPQGPVLYMVSAACKYVVSAACCQQLWAKNRAAGPMTQGAHLRCCQLWAKNRPAVNSESRAKLVSTDTRRTPTLLSTANLTDPCKQRGELALDEHGNTVIPCSLC
jgi:hypothetical protein